MRYVKVVHGEVWACRRTQRGEARPFAASCNMDKCWANTLSRCGDKLTREHYVSESLWEGTSIDVVGLPWCRNEAKRIGLGSLTAHILCDKHNNDLSPLDEAASKAFKTLTAMTILTNARTKKPARKWKRVRYEIDGPLLERWFLKTAVNLSILHKTNDVWSLDGSPLSSPSETIARLTFGYTPIARPMGLYAGASVGDDVQSREGFEAAPVYNFDHGLVAYVFQFHGLRFALWLNGTEPPTVLHVPWGRGKAAKARDLIYHLVYIKNEIGGHISDYVDFMWPGRTVPYWRTK